VNIIDESIEDNETEIVNILQPCHINLSRYIRSNELNKEELEEHIEGKVQLAILS